MAGAAFAAPVFVYMRGCVLASTRFVCLVILKFNVNLLLCVGFSPCRYISGFGSGSCYDNHIAIYQTSILENQSEPKLIK